MLQHKLRRYALKYSFNADEFGLNYRMATNITVATERLPGRKMAEECISVLAYLNADRSEKCELMIIGTAWKPQLFKRKTGADLGFD